MTVFIFIFLCYCWETVAPSWHVEDWRLSPVLSEQHFTLWKHVAATEYSRTAHAGEWILAQVWLSVLQTAEWQSRVNRTLSVVTSTALIPFQRGAHIHSLGQSVVRNLTCGHHRARRQKQHICEIRVQRRYKETASQSPTQNDCHGLHHGWNMTWENKTTTCRRGSILFKLDSLAVFKWDRMM